jgi:hypothetical protein
MLHFTGLQPVMRRSADTKLVATVERIADWVYIREVRGSFPGLGDPIPD